MLGVNIQSIKMIYHCKQTAVIFSNILLYCWVHLALLKAGTNKVTVCIPVINAINESFLYKILVFQLIRMGGPKIKKKKKKRQVLQKFFFGDCYIL